MADMKVNKTRMTLVGDVDLTEVQSVLARSFPNLGVKVWARKGKSAKKAVKVSTDDVKDV